MDNVTLLSKRIEMKFPLQFINPSIIVDAIGDEDTIRFMDTIPAMEYTEIEAQKFISFLERTQKSETELELGIFDIQTNQFIGMCSLENIDRKNKVCELGYWLNKSYVGRGYMAECVETILQYAKDELDMESINAYVIVGNNKSTGLLERHHFIQKELLKNDTINKGVIVDRYWYKLSL